MEWKANLARNETIRKMRRRGCSIPEISKELGVSKATVSLHCKNVEVVNQRLLEKKKDSAKRKARTLLRSLSAERKNDWNQRKESTRLEAMQEWGTVKTDPVMMGFLGLYWGEGNRRSQCIGIVNNDPGVIAAAISIFRKLNPEAKFDTQVRYYPEHDPEKCKSFWENVLGTDVKMRPKVWLGKGRRYYSKFGICYVRFSDWKTKLKIMTWIGLWRESLVGMTGFEPAFTSTQTTRVARLRYIP